MRSYPISKFKVHALGILSGIAETGETVLVTKRGRPIVRVEPYGEPERVPTPGRLAGTITFEGDLDSSGPEGDRG